MLFYKISLNQYALNVELVSYTKIQLEMYDDIVYFGLYITH